MTTMWSPKNGEDSLKVLTDLGIQREVTIAGSDLESIKSVAEAYLK